MFGRDAASGLSRPVVSVREEPTLPALLAIFFFYEGYSAEAVPTRESLILKRLQVHKGTSDNTHGAGCPIVPHILRHSGQAPGDFT